MKMKSRGELKEIDIKNCKSYYFDDIIRARIDLYSTDLLLDKTLYKENHKNVLTHFTQIFNGCTTIAY